VNGYRFLDGPTPLAIAHRGVAPDGVENSMVAFERAVRLGYRYLETDVRISRDGVLVAFHDPTLRRTTGRRGYVAALPWAELARARIRGREPIPRLEDVLGAWPDLRIILDVKASAAVLPLADLLRRTGAVERVCVGAFSDTRLRRIRAAVGPRLATSMGPREVFRLRLASLRATGPDARCNGVPCVQVPPRLGAIAVLDGRFVTVAHRRGLQVHAWTINDRTEMARLLDLGVDGIMTDRAEVLRDVLRDRGQWSGGQAPDR